MHISLKESILHCEKPVLRNGHENQRWQTASIVKLIFCLDQDERSRSVEAFRKQHKDVLVATDVASKGLDFEGIQHVINYDMPDDVENYGKQKNYSNFKLFII